MKKVIISIALAGSVFLTSCTGLGNLPVQINTLTSQTQAFAQALCKFLPTAQTIGAVAASLFPGGGAIDTVANGVAAAICSAVAGTPVPATPVPVSISAAAVHGQFGVARKVSINGVVIEGQFAHSAKKFKRVNGVLINGEFSK